MSSEKCTNRKNFRLSSEKCTNLKIFRLSSENAPKMKKFRKNFFSIFLKKTLAKVFSVGIIGLMKST